MWGDSPPDSPPGFISSITNQPQQRISLFPFGNRRQQGRPSNPARPSNSAVLRCPTCSVPTSNEAELISHYIGNHHQQSRSQSIICPTCSQYIINEAQLINHYVQEHQAKSLSIKCPVCNNAGYQDGLALVKHLELKHSVILPVMDKEKTAVIDEQAVRRLPQAGDRIIAMWGESKWQYFTAKIRKFIRESLKYEIDWDDGGTTGRIVDYYNIAKDKAPAENELGIGTIVLFPQGYYKAGATHGIGGKRWHQGVILNSYRSHDGTKRYDGSHTKTGQNGKFVTYRDYSHSFNGLTRHDVRVPPNVFDIYDDGDTTDETADIYFSYNPIDSPSAFKHHEVNKALVPESYLCKYEQMCDPANIETFLRKQGYNVVKQIHIGEHDAKQVAIKSAKIFIACISDAYVNDENCRREFQYAKNSLQKPVIPLVVGDGSFAWTMTVIGMLIAGELFIHFSGLDVEIAKNKELLSNVKTLMAADKVTKVKEIEVNTNADKGSGTKNNDGAPDVFLSYCWQNSYKDEDAKQITNVNGSRFSDPRLLKEMIAQLGYNVWLDIEQLHSADANANLFDQIVDGLKSTKVVVACISDDYSKSQNCRMEFQFALKSLQKPVVPLIVGKGEEWKLSVIGALIVTHQDDPINLQIVKGNSELDVKFDEIKKAIQSRISNATTHVPMTPITAMTKDMSIKQESIIIPTQRSGIKPNIQPFNNRVPQPGDHVISLYFKCAYFMATVVSYNHSSMTYTINWDDGGRQGREQPYNQVAKDFPPERDDIGVGTYVFFPQGSYGATEGQNEGGIRYHEGEVTHVSEDRYGRALVSGHHTKGAEDGKWVTHKRYSYNFYDIPISYIRLAPTALEVSLR